MLLISAIKLSGQSIGISRWTCPSSSDIYDVGCSAGDDIDDVAGDVSVDGVIGGVYC